MFKFVMVCVGFLGCLVFAVRGATPVILNYTESAATGDIIYVQGSGFGTTPSIEYSYNDSNWNELSPITSGQGCVTVKIPGSETRLPDLLTVRVSADAATWSAPVYINKAIALSFDTDQVAPGSNFRIFGRNLFFDRAPSVRFSDTNDGSNLPATVNLSNSTHYALNVTAPAVKPGHTYQVFVSNGYSGNSPSPVESLASKPLIGRATGTDYWQLGLPWAADLSFYTNVYNVKTDPRLGSLLATGDGIADDTWPINHALQVASAAGGGVVYLPEGTYTIHIPNGCGIQLLQKTVLQGSAAGQVNVNYGYPVNGPGGYGVCFANLSGVANLVLNNIDTAQQWKWSSLSVSNSEVFIKNVTWNIGTSQWLAFSGDDHVAIENSTINQGVDSNFNYLGPLLMENCAHCEVENTNINFSVCGISFDGASDFVFENNNVTRDISTSPNPSTVTHSIAADFVKNFVVLNNTFRSVGDGLPTNNDGEVINTEGGAGTRYDEFRGSISSATSTTLTDSSQNFFQSSNHIPNLRPGIATVAIVSGEGLGQSRNVTAVSADGTTISIDHPWDVQPEVGSHYTTFDWSAENWTVINNQLNGNFKGLEIFDASAINVLFETNTLIDSNGIYISPSENAPGMFNVVKNISITGNILTDLAGLRPSYVGLIPREDQQMASFGTHIIGANVKANSVTAYTPNVFNSPVSYDDFKVKTEGFLCYYFWQSDSGYDESAPPPLLGTVFQGNMAWNSKAAFYLNSGASQTTISGSLITNAVLTQQDLPTQGASRGSTGTTMTESLKVYPIGSGVSAAKHLVHGTASPFGLRAIAIGHQGGAYSLNNTEDNLNLLGEEMGTNAEIVTHLTVNSNLGVAGVLMMRATASAKSAFTSIGLGPNGIEFKNRTFTGGTTQTQEFPFTGNSAWLKLQKVSNVITAKYSLDGSDWQDYASKVEFPARLYLAGVAEVSDGNQNTIATFDSLTFSAIKGVVAAQSNTPTNNASQVASGARKASQSMGVRSSKWLVKLAVASWRIVRMAMIRLI